MYFQVPKTATGSLTFEDRSFSDRLSLTWELGIFQVPNCK